MGEAADWVGATSRALALVVGEPAEVEQLRWEWDSARRRLARVERELDRIGGRVRRLLSRAGEGIAMLAEYGPPGHIFVAEGEYPVMLDDLRALLPSAGGSAHG